MITIMLERSVDAVGEISEMKKVIIVLYLAPTGLVSGGQTAYFFFVTGENDLAMWKLCHVCVVE